MNIISSAKNITIKDVRSMLRWNPYSSRKDKVLDAFIIGSVAKGTAHEKSDIDIAVIIPKLSKPSLKVSELYHGKFRNNDQMPNFDGYRVDLQFFYEGDVVLNEYQKMPLSKK